MRRPASLLAALLVLALALTPSLAEARAGSGTSSGSRGTRTYVAPAPTNTAPGYVAPMQRSLTPQTAPAPGYAPAYGGRPSFMGGFMGGLIGGGLLGLLFGGGLFHGGFGFGGLLGLLIQLALLYYVGRWLVGLVLNRSPAMATGPAMFTGSGLPGQSRPGAGAVPIGPGDFQEFEHLLQGVQAAWSQHDLTTLRMIATPEMVSYFGEQMAEQTSRNVRNIVKDVKLEQGDLSEAWAEQGREYATVAMRFSMVDVTVTPQGQVVDGHPTERVQATEVWTFLRAPGGRWVLSAIQQVR
jgi:predicted lipid-binding transport protein (Tim44 family)